MPVFVTCSPGAHGTQLLRVQCNGTGRGDHVLIEFDADGKCCEWFDAQMVDDRRRCVECNDAARADLGRLMPARISKVLVRTDVARKDITFTTCTCCDDASAIDARLDDAADNTAKSVGFVQVHIHFSPGPTALTFTAVNISNGYYSHEIDVTWNDVRFPTTWA